MVSPTASSFYTDGGVYDESDVVPNDVIAPDTTPSTSPSSFFSDGNVVGTGTVVSNDHTPDPTPSATPGSYYTDGGAVDEGTVVDNDHAAPSGNTTAPGSYYPNGNIYDFLSEESVVLQALEALAAQVQVDKIAADNSASAAATSESNAATSEANADTSEANAASSASASAASASLSNTRANAAATSETNAANSATAAANSATNAATSAGTATTQAGIATTQAGIATTQAGIATTQAGNASTSATNAHTSELNAAASASVFFPSGTRMLFQQTAAPTGWTKDTTHNDKALRIVSGSVGSGGTNAFSTVMAQTTVGATTLTAAQVPNLSVSVSGTITVYPAGTSAYYVPISTSGWAAYPNTTAFTGITAPYATNNYVTYTNVWSGGNSMTGGTTNGGGGSHSHPITMNIQYVDFIIATKN